MSSESDPVILELAPLPREQLGPFLLLGVEKSADAEQVEAAWAQRLIAARKNQIAIALEEINWAREVIRDPDRRVLADATSLNTDTFDGAVARLAHRCGVAGPAWEPLEAERPQTGDRPEMELPTAAELRAAIVFPEPPRAIPAVARLLDEFASQPIDPWAFNLPSDPDQDD